MDSHAETILQTLIADAARQWRYAALDLEVLMGRRPAGTFTPTVESVRAKATAAFRQVEQLFPVVKEGKRVFRTTKDGRRFPEVDWKKVAGTVIENDGGYVDRLPVLSDFWLLRSILDYLEEQQSDSPTPKKTATKKTATKKTATKKTASALKEHGFDTKS